MKKSLPWRLVSGMDINGYQIYILISYILINWHNEQYSSQRKCPWGQGFHLNALGYCHWSIAHQYPWRQAVTEDTIYICYFFTLKFRQWHVTAQWNNAISKCFPTKVLIRRGIWKKQKNKQTINSNHFGLYVLYVNVKWQQRIWKHQ